MNKEAELQNEFINKLKSKVKNIKNGDIKKYVVKTYGCQMNARDSEKLEGILEKIGYTKSDDEKTCDIVIYNTCCIRENAENKVYGRLGHLKKIKETNKDMTIVLCGCMMQEEHIVKTIKEKYRHVDIVFGTHNIYKFPEILYNYLENKHRTFDIWDDFENIVEDLPSKRKHKHRASVNIVYGCNNFCTYCIVPYVRGRERSRQVDDILNEIRTLVSDGVKEIILLGQNVNSYGKTLENKTNFSELLTLINDIDGIERIRFMTSHPKDLSDELIMAMSKCDKVCNHLHLPFQAGSNAVLKAMNRGYTKESYLELAEKIKKYNKGIELTTDIIVGFPEETEEDFLETIDVVKKIRFSNAYTFLYSKRKGTKANEMENQVPEDVKHKRFDKLLKVLDTIVEEESSKYLNKTVKVLVDDMNKKDDNLLTGRTDTNYLVHFNGSEEYVGKVVDVYIKETKPYFLIGELVE